jgi:hypothetical protein
MSRHSSRGLRPPRRGRNLGAKTNPAGRRPLSTSQQPTLPQVETTTSNTRPTTDTLGCPPARPRARAGLVSAAFASASKTSDVERHSSGRKGDRQTNPQAAWRNAPAWTLARALGTYCPCSDMRQGGGSARPGSCSESWWPSRSRPWEGQQHVKHFRGLQVRRRVEQQRADRHPAGLEVALELRAKRTNLVGLLSASMR